jgi:hypothetical protein
MYHVVGGMQYRGSGIFSHRLDDRSAFFGQYIHAFSKLENPEPESIHIVYPSTKVSDAKTLSLLQV